MFLVLSVYTRSAWTELISNHIVMQMVGIRSSAVPTRCGTVTGLRRAFLPHALTWMPRISTLVADLLSA